MKYTDRPLAGPVSVNESVNAVKRHKILVAAILCPITIVAVYLAFARSASGPEYVAQTAIQVILSKPADQLDPNLSAKILPITMTLPSFIEAAISLGSPIKTSGDQPFGDVAVQEFLENLSVSPADERGIIKISFKSVSPITAKVALKNYSEAALDIIRRLREEKEKEYKEQTASNEELLFENRLKGLNELLDGSRKMAISGSDESKNFPIWYSINSLANSYFQREIDLARQDLKKEQQKIKEALTTDIIRLVEPIKITVVHPKAKSNTSRAMILIAGIGLACLLGMATAIGIDRRSGLINSAVDVDNRGYPVVALVPQIGSETLFVQEGLSEPIAKSLPESSAKLLAFSGIENVAARLWLSDRGDDVLKTVFIGSSKTAEGKTFMSLSLAIQAAQAGKKTLLIECNFRDPKVGEILKCGEGVGFSTFLKNRQEIGELPVIQTALSGLNCVTAGQTSQNPLPLFLSDHFRQILKEIRLEYDCVFVDTPAILEHAETVAISALCDAQLLVVRQVCKTSLAEMETAVRKISHKDSVFLGVIMNGYNG